MSDAQAPHEERPEDASSPEDAATESPFVQTPEDTAPPGPAEITDPVIAEFTSFETEPSSAPAQSVQSEQVSEVSTDRPDQPVTTDSPVEPAEVEPAEVDPAAPKVTPPKPNPVSAPTRALRPLPRVIAIANQKGGVGKTTTTVNLSAALAEQDHRVLVIDLDPQGNATTGLGIVARDLEHSIYDVLLNDVDLDDAIESTAVLNLFLCPASLDLAGAEIELVSVMSRETRLRHAIDQVRDDYDYIIIDCPPSLGLLTVNALAAASEVLVPVQCEYYALEGLGQLLRNVNLVQRNLNPPLELSLIVLVMYDGRTKLGEQVATEVREHFGDRVCRNVIPRNIRLSEAPSYGQPITVFDSSSTGAVAYRELAREVHHGSA